MDYKNILKELTIEEKCSLLVGRDGWRTKNIDRLNIPSIMMADGPHGLRKVIDGTSVHENTEKAVCYPSMVTVASSFDPKIAYKMGNSIAKEFKSKGVSLILGPGVNIKRHPFCGRNFEYYSEDPVVTYKMAEGFIKGAKKEGIGVCVKHYALNSQEDYRMTSSSVADERAKYEIYYKSFQELMKLDPEMVMCSYNKVDGVYASENIHLLKEVLRDEFGFKNVIVSDWGAVSNRTKALIATLDLEMPGYIWGINTMINDVIDDKLSIEVLDASVERILTMVDKFKNQEQIDVDLDKHHLISAEIAAQSMVLLKNEDDLLPINDKERILLVGDMAKNVRYQGGGSSHINSYKVDTIFDVLTKHENIDYVQGYTANRNEIDTTLLNEVKNLAPNYSKVIIVCGLPDEYESEGYDREHLSIPNKQDFLINQISKINRNIILVLQIGSPIVMPFIYNVKSILNCYLGGEALGLALESVLFGKVNPSGRLAETFPMKASDVPSNPYFATGNNNVFYQESIYVGYRYYKSTNKKVLFPFGYGLSYSHFEYSNLVVNKTELKNGKQVVTLSVDITNNGPYDGSEVVMLFYEAKNPKTPRPKRELIDFDKVFIKNGKTETISFKVNKDSFNYYHPKRKEFVTDDGLYHLQISKNARDMLMEQPITVSLGKEYVSSVWNHIPSYLPSNGLNFSKADFSQLIDQPVIKQFVTHHRPFNLDNNVEDIQHTFFGKILKNKLEKEAVKNSINQDEQFVKMMKIGMKQLPLRALVQLSSGQVQMNTMLFMIEMINRHYIKALKHLFRKD